MTFNDKLSRYQELLDIARSFNRVTKLDSLLEEILRRSQDVLGIEACSLFLLDRKTGELVIHSARGNSAPMLAAARIPKGAGIAGSVFESKKLLTIKDAKNDPRHYAGMDEKTGFVTRSMIAVPLLNNDECFGVLQALNPIGREFFDETDEAICETFASLVVNVLLRLESHKREIEQICVKQELELASEIQHSFLPEPYLTFESHRLYMNYTPAKQIGGDFCFFQSCERQQRFLVGLGDVSGKGVPAALTMASVAATIKAMFCQLEDDLGAWVAELNRRITADLRGGRFVGITFILADVSSEKIHVCAAGQYPPFYMNGQTWKRLDIEKQMPLGI
ncbi:MAG: GAF domain-containing SpoIIE family protein phosphatase, partial [bacterium]